MMFIFTMAHSHSHQHGHHHHGGRQNIKVALHLMEDTWAMPAEVHCH